MFTSTIASIKKRNGEVVEFEPEKISKVIKAALLDVMGDHDLDLVKRITEDSIDKLEKRFIGKIPNVEDVQNIVEMSLMSMGQFAVAKSYIIYRFEHAKEREIKKREVQEKIEVGGLQIIKRSGESQTFSIEKLIKTISFFCNGYEGVVDPKVIANQVRSEIYEDITTDGIERSVIMVLRSWIEQDPIYSFIAARAVLNRNYKDVIGRDKFNINQITDQLRKAFITNITNGVSIGKLDPRMLAFDMEQLSSTLDFERDKTHAYLSIQTLTDRYFITNIDTKEILETPQSFWMRVAMGLAINEPNRNERAIEFYNVMSKLLFVPSTPTLFHAGTNHPQLSSCYLTTISDSLDHIFKCIGDNAQLSKWSGGIGNDWTNLRGIGSLIHGTGVPSQGVIPFLKIANDTTAAINRSGRRRGATCAYLETWHWDIEDFLELRKNTGDERRRTHDMNTSNWVPDLFMKRVKEDANWSLFSPNETPDLHDLYGKKFDQRYSEYEKKGEAGELAQYKTIKARDLWKKMLTMLFETGHPWITFKDPCNLRSPQDHVGLIHSSNLCTEITLNTSSEETAVCNLGSVNLERHIVDGKLNEVLIASTIKTGMRMLDNVIDINFYPTKEAKNANMRHRPVGLGMMGFQNALYKLEMNFDSEQAIEFADYSGEVFAYNAILGSSELARERGVYSTYKGSKWDRGIFPLDTIDILENERGVKIDVSRKSRLDWTVVKQFVSQNGMRNSNIMAIAPTATISNIAGTTPTIEPIYKNIYVKSNQAGDFTIVNPYLVQDLKKVNLWDSEMLGKLKYNDGNISQIIEIPQEIKDKYKEVFQINSEWLIRSAAYRGKWIDQSQSLNIFYSGKSGRDISDIYIYAWDMGLKTTYYMRTLAVSQVEKSTVNTSEYGQTHNRNSEINDSSSISAKHIGSVEKVIVETSIAPATAILNKTEQIVKTSTAPAVAILNKTEQIVKNKPSEEIVPVAPRIDTTVFQINKQTPISPDNFQKTENQNTENQNIESPVSEIKLCRIEDPDCEACQ